MTPCSPESSTEALLRDLAPQVLGAVMRRFGDFDAAEDAVQEAMIAASAQWPANGTPENPRGWLIQVASRRAVDALRSERARRDRELTVDSAEVPAAPDPSAASDDTLALLFMCCHPSLTPPSALALTLRAVGGMTTADIAAAFMTPVATMGQRISRAKQTIKASGVPFKKPTDEEAATRLPTVLHVLYLIFNEGYTSTAGADLHRRELSDEAIRLTRMVHSLVPHSGEVTGLLALMLLTDARRLARATPDGELVPLAEQDRGVWDRAMIAEGTALLEGALGKGSVGPYQLQAAIAALHDAAERAEDTDWPQILALYTLLERMTDNPMVTLNLAIATAMVRGPRAGLELLDELDSDERMARHHRLAAVRGHLLERAGDRAAALEQYRFAAARTPSIPEQNYLRIKAASLEEGDVKPPPGA